jgi:hypothetical protein
MTTTITTITEAEILSLIYCPDCGGDGFTYAEDGHHRSCDCRPLRDRAFAALGVATRESLIEVLSVLSAGVVPSPIVAVVNLSEGLLDAIKGYARCYDEALSESAVRGGVSVDTGLALMAAEGRVSEYARTLGLTAHRF